MKFSTREDVEAPIERVFEMLCAVEEFERAAMRRGADIQRLDDLPQVGLGAQWQVQFVSRGKARDVNLRITNFEPPDAMMVTLTSEGVIGNMDFELIALSRNKTRLIVALEVRPQTLSARLLIQSLKLTKGALNRRYQERIAGYASEIEARYKDTA